MPNSLYHHPPQQQVTLIIVDENSCYEVTVPGHTEAEGVGFLELIGSGMLGSGLRMTRFGQTVPLIRMQYERRLKALEKQIGHMQAKVDDGRMSKEQYARLLYQKRRDIAYVNRFQQGLGAVALLEARDWVKYGAGGRSWKNIYGRAVAKSKLGRDPLDRITQNAPEPNKRLAMPRSAEQSFLRMPVRYSLSSERPWMPRLSTPPLKENALMSRAESALRLLAVLSVVEQP